MRLKHTFITKDAGKCINKLTNKERDMLLTCLNKIEDIIDKMLILIEVNSEFILLVEFDPVEINDYKYVDYIMNLVYDILEEYDIYFLSSCEKTCFYL